MNRPRSAPWTAVLATRAAYGVMLFALPGPTWAAFTRSPASQRGRQVTRLLGVRHLVQAAVSASAGPGAAFPGAVVDGLHAASMLVVAAADGRARRACLADVGLESLLAAAGIALTVSFV